MGNEIWNTENRIWDIEKAKAISAQYWADLAYSLFRPWTSLPLSQPTRLPKETAGIIPAYLARIIPEDLATMKKSF